MGLHNKINHKENTNTLFFLCLAAVIFTYPVDKIITRIAISLVGDLPSYFHYQLVQPNMLLLKWLSALYFALSAGIVEELYYRGLFYKAVQSSSQPKLVCLLISPAIFAIAHWELGQDNVLETYIFGMFASLIYLKIKNLWPLIFGHVIIDYLWFSA